MKISQGTKLAVSHLAGAFCAYAALLGMEELAKRLGGFVGARLAPVVNPLLMSDEPRRRALGFVLVFGTLVPLATGAGVASSAATMSTFFAVESAVSKALADEDWTVLDELGALVEAEVERRRHVFSIQSKIFGVVPAVLGILGIDIISVHEVDTD